MSSCAGKGTTKYRANIPNHPDGALTLGEETTAAKKRDVRATLNIVVLNPACEWARSLYEGA